MQIFVGLVNIFDGRKPDVEVIDVRESLFALETIGK